MTNEQLALAIQSGDCALYEMLWQQMAPLVRKLSYQYYTVHRLPVGVDFEDCLQWGYLALVRSVQSYDPQKDYKMTSYLWNHLQNVMGDALHIRSGRQNIKTCSYNVITIDDSDELELIDTLEDEKTGAAFDRIELTDTQRIVMESVERLPPDQRKVIDLLYFRNLPRKEAAKRLWITEQQVASLREKALRTLRRDRRLRELYREYARHNNHWECGVDFYFSRSFRQVTEEIRRKRQSGIYISYGKEKAALYLAAMAFQAGDCENVFPDDHASACSEMLIQNSK